MPISNGSVVTPHTPVDNQYGDLESTDKREREKREFDTYKVEDFQHAYIVFDACG